MYNIMHREKEDTKEHNVMMQLIVMIVDCHSYYPTTIHTLDIYIRQQYLPTIIMLYNRLYIPDTIQRR